MAFRTADFVKETTLTTGTGAITLAGARSPAQTFSAVCSNGDTFQYAISHDTLNQWEVGLGTYNTGGNTITRTTVLASSNGGAAVNFSAGTKKVDLVLPAARIVQLVGPVQIGATSFGSGSLSFSNANGISFSLSTNSNGGTIQASHNGLTSAADSLIGVISHVGGNSVSNVSKLAFANASNVTWSLSTVVSAATVFASVPDGLLFVTGNGTSGSVTRIDLQNANGASWLMSTGASALSLSLSYRAIRSLSLNSPSLSSLTTATDTAATAAQLVFFPNLNTSFNTSLSYNNVGFRFTTGGSSAVVNVGAWARYFASNQTDGVTAQQLSFSDANGVTFGIATTSIANSGVIPIVTASVAAGGGGGITAFALSNAASSVMATGLTFSNANGLSFLLSTAAGNAATLSASYTVPTVPTHTLAASAAGNSISNGTFVLSNSNNVSFGMAGSTITATATVAATRDIGVVSHVGGNVVSSVSQLAFSNASNVTFSLSTAANAATVLASVAAAGGNTLSGFAPYQGELVSNSFGAGTSGTWNLSPFELPAAVQFDRLVHAISITGSTSTVASNSVSISLALYSRNASTLSFITGVTSSFAYTLSSNVNSSLHYGWKLLTFPLTSTLAAGNYWLGLGSRLSTAGGGGGQIGNGMVSSNVPPNGGIGLFSVATNASVQIRLGLGGFSGTTSTIASSIAFSALIGSLSIHQRNPYVYFASGTA